MRSGRSTVLMSAARELFRRNMDVNPGSLDATVTYLQLLGYMNDWDVLEHAADSALARFPKETGFLEMKNVACYNKNDYQGIIDNFIRVNADKTISLTQCCSVAGLGPAAIPEVVEALKRVNPKGTVKENRRRDGSYDE